ncbi:hypothetical protein SMWOGL2_41810 [Sporomusa malonica]
MLTINVSIEALGEGEKVDAGITNMDIRIQIAL